LRAELDQDRAWNEELVRKVVCFVFGVRVGGRVWVVLRRAVDIDIGVGPEVVVA